MPDFRKLVIFEDNHLLVIAKPAGIATMGIADQQASLVGQAKIYLKQKYDKPGNVYLGVVSRLDSLVSGVVVFARTSKAAARLNDQFRANSVKKIYWAVVQGKLAPESGTLRDHLRKNESRQRMEVVSAVASGAKEAVLHFETITRHAQWTLLAIRLETGRKHQIRAQLSACGHPILGDRKYGSQQPFEQGIALHSRSLQLSHPISKEQLEFSVEPPPSWHRFALDL
jgi:23S rRNA pseudouridine1911/1915/1917 synthase